MKSPMLDRSDLYTIDLTGTGPYAELLTCDECGCRPCECDRDEFSWEDEEL